MNSAAVGLAIALGLVLSGAIILIVAIRGRRLDNHPICRRCRFDLLGVHGRDDARCPECGALLSGPRDVRRGNRRRRPRLAALGLVLLLAGAIPAGLLVYGSAAGIDWNQHKPAWWLAIDIESSDSAGSDAAVHELTSRLTNGNLSSEWRTWLIDRAMTRYTEDEPWSLAWTDLMDHLYTSGLLNEEQRIAYVRGAPVLSLVTRPRTVKGSDWAPNLQVAAPRLGNGSFLIAKLEPTSMSLNGTPVPAGFSGTMIAGLSGGSTSSMAISVPFGPAHEPGMHQISTRWRISILESFEEDSPVMTSWEFERLATVELLPEGASLISLVDAPQLAEEIRKSVHLTPNIRPAGAPGGGSGMIFIRSAPMYVAFDVICRAQDPSSESGFCEWKAGTVVGGPGNHGTGFNTHLPEGIDVNEVDVILRASPDAALRTTHINEIWDGEIIITGVKVTNDAESKEEPPP